MKGRLLERVPPGNCTWIVPVVAPEGTVAIMSVADFTVNAAVVPWNVTPVALLRLVPRIPTFFPTLAAAGFVSTNGPRPTDRLKTVPALLGPPL